MGRNAITRRRPDGFWTYSILIVLAIIGFSGLNSAFIHCLRQQRPIFDFVGNIDDKSSQLKLLLQYETLLGWLQIYNKNVVDALSFKAELRELEDKYSVELRPTHVENAIIVLRLRMAACIMNANSVTEEYNFVASTIDWSIWKVELGEVLKGESRIELPEQLVMVSDFRLIAGGQE